MPRFPVALLVSLSLFMVSSEGTASPSRQVKELVSSFRLERSNMRHAVELWRLAELEDWVDAGQRQKIDQLLVKLSGNRKIPLALKRLALHMLAGRHRRASRAKDLQATCRRLGVVQSWWVAGPYDNEGNRGHNTAYPPEEALGEDPSSSGKDILADWRQVPFGPADGYLKLHDVFRPKTHGVAYALAGLHTKRRAPVMLYAGCDDACKVWIDGQLVLDDPGLHGHAPDQHILAMTLSRGHHRVLVKVSQNEGAWGFSLAVTNPRGEPVDGLEVVDTEPGLRKALSLPLQDGPGPVKPVPSLTSWFLDRAERLPKDPWAQAEAALALSYTRANDVREKPVERLVRQAVAQLESCHDDCGLLRLLLARVTTDVDLAMRLLEEVTGPKSQRAESLGYLGLLQSIRNRPDRALRAHRQALKLDPRHLPSELGQVELLQRVGLWGLATRRVDDLLARYPDVPEVLLVAANIHRGSGQVARSHDLYRQLIDTKGDDRAALRALCDLAVLRGDLSEALDWLDRLIALSPSRIDWWIERGDLLLHNGRQAEALQAYQRAHAICPREPDPLIREGAAHQTTGRTDRALAKWRQALSLIPQNQELLRHIEFLQQKRETFYRPWVKNIREYTPEPEALKEAENVGAVRLLDLTVVRLYPNGLVSRYHRQLLRILNQRGADNSRFFQIEYAPGRQQVRVLKSRVLRPDGSTDESVLVNDFALSEPWYNLYYDVHSRQITFPSLSPGEIVELSYQVDNVGNRTLLDAYFGDLAPFAFFEPTREVTYVLLLPAGREINFNAPEHAHHETRVGKEGEIEHRWTARNLPAVEPEPNMPGFMETRSFLHLSSHRDWHQLASWYRDLSSDQLVPGPEVKSLAGTLAQGLEDKMEIIRSVYRFVADRTRYVGLEFGIHSYIPYQVSQVLTRKFGDCKDKAALLVSLFEELGIRAHLALVRTRRLGLVEDSPASLAVFDHAICYLPDQKLWLDATVPFHDITELPAQDQGVPALVVAEDARGLSVTPSSGPDHNRTEISFVVKTDPDGHARVESRIEVRGSLAPALRAQFVSSSARKDVFEKSMNEMFPGVEVQSLEIDNLLRPDLPLTTRARFRVPSMARVTDTTIDLAALGRNTIYQKIYSPFQERRHDLLLSPPWKVVWNITFQPPDGFDQVELPPGGSLIESFGRAELSFSRDQEKVKVRASFQLDKSRIQATDYKAFRDFLGRVDRFFDRRIVFTSSTRPVGGA